MTSSSAPGTHNFMLPRIELVEPGMTLAISNAVGVLVHLGHDEIVCGQTERIVFVAYQVYAPKCDAAGFVLRDHFGHPIDLGMRWVLKEGAADPA